MIISNSAWNKISAEDKPKVDRRRAGAREDACAPRTPAQDAESVEAMTTRGLQVIKLDPKAAAEFRAAATELVTTMRGDMVPADIFDMAVQERDAVPEVQRQVV